MTRLHDDDQQDYTPSQAAFDAYEALCVSRDDDTYGYAADASGTAYRVELDDRSRARHITCVGGPDAAALEAAGRGARSARVESIYDAPDGGISDIKLGGYARVAVLMHDGKSRRATVRLAIPSAQ